MELEKIEFATGKYCFYKFAVNGDVYDINVKELDQVFCVGYHALSFEPRYSQFIEWMRGNAVVISLKTGESVYVVPLSHKIKYLSDEMRAVISYIQNQDDNNYVICTDKVIDARYEGFWFNLWMRFRFTTGLYSRFIHGLFRVKALDVACKVIESRR